MWPQISPVIPPMNSVASIAKGRKLFCNTCLELDFKYPKKIISIATLRNYFRRAITFTVHNGVYDKYMCAVISKICKNFSFLSRILTSSHHKYTMAEKKIISIVEHLKKV